MTLIYYLFYLLFNRFSYLVCILTKLCSILFELIAGWFDRETQHIQQHSRQGPTVYVREITVVNISR